MDHIVQDWFHPPGWTPSATHQCNTSVGPASVCFWFEIVQKCGCLCSVQNMGFPTVETQQHVCKSCFVSALELSERLSRWLWRDSHRTCIRTTPTLDDKQMIQETVSLSPLVDHYLRVQQMWAGSLMTQVIQQVTNHESNGPRGGRSGSRKWNIWTSQETEHLFRVVWF